MFNEEQKAHMHYLASIPPENRCWSGWCERGADGKWKYCCAPAPCAIDLTLADRLRQECECCGREDGLHRKGCTPEIRRDHYAHLELGGEA